MLIYLENIYLCGVNNNDEQFVGVPLFIVICLKISIFVVSTTTPISAYHSHRSCDLLENIYLCGINNNSFFVICCLSK